MSKSTYNTDREWTAAVIGKPRWYALLWAALLIGAVLLIWQGWGLAVSQPNWLLILVSMLGSALISFLAASLVLSLGSKNRWMLRMALLVPPLVMACCLARQLPGHLLSWVVGLLVAAVGSFAGIVTAAGIQGVLWENNSPPADHIQQEVYLRHQKYLKHLEPPGWEKRWFDVLVAGAGLLFSSPVWFACAMFTWLEDPGPILFVKNSVGIGGANFRQLKFRTMVRGAEAESGPVLAQEQDQRVLTVGKLLRKTALDEIPQLINILKGEMSLVGPRPQRTVLVCGYLEKMPEYAERHRVLPGLSGLAQVAGDYYLSPRQKLRFDRLYIQHCSLGFDVKLILLAGLITFWYRWQKDWNGRLPRGWLHRGYRSGSHPKDNGL